MHWDATVKESAAARIANYLSVPAGEKIDEDAIRDVFDAARAKLGIRPRHRRRWILGAAALTAGVGLIYADAGPMWTPHARRSIYLVDPPRLHESIYVDSEGAHHLATIEKTGGIKFRITNSRLLRDDEVEAESTRLLNKFKPLALGPMRAPSPN